MQLLSCPFSILVTEDRNRPADPPGDHLVSRPVTKFSGQPSLPVYWLQSITGTEIYYSQKLLVTEETNGQKLLVTEKTNDFFEQQEKRWSTLKQALIVSGQGSVIIQMTIYTFFTLQATGLGPRVYKM